MNIIKPNRFVGLHAHSGFSIYDGMSLPRKHIDYVLDNGMDAWALTDHGNANGHAHAFTHARDVTAKGRQFKFIPGVEFYLHPDLKQWQLEYAHVKDAKAAAKSARKSSKTNNTDLGSAVDSDEEGGGVVEDEEATKQTRRFDPLRRRHHLIVLARDQRGLENLYTLVTRSYDEGFYAFPRIDYAMLREHSEGLIVSTACLGGPLSYIPMMHHSTVQWESLHPGIDDEESFATIQRDMSVEVDRLVDAVGERNLYLEVQFNRLGAQHLVNKHMIELSRSTGLPLLATADSHYPRPELWKDRELYKKLGWLGYDKYEPGLLPASVDELKAELYPKNAEQMWDSYHDSITAFSHVGSAEWNFYDDAEICAAIERSYDIAHDICGDAVPASTVIYPVRRVLGDVWSGETADVQDREAFGRLVGLVKEGLRTRHLQDDVRYVERARDELEVIRDKKFSMYFLTIARVMEVANKHMLCGPGRGSAAGSLVNYLLGVTRVDPLRYDLLFARFLSRQRKEAPDVDSDVSDNDALKQLLRDEFGEENVIPISNVNTLALKSLIKDTSRFYGIDFAEVNAATAGVERDVRRAVIKPGDDKNVFVLKYEDALEHSPKFRAFIEQHPEVGTHIVNLIEQNKSIGRHAGGVIIGDDIHRRMPVIRIRGEKQSAWVEGLHFRHLEAVGSLLKYDLLGLKTLRIIEKCIALILDDVGVYTLQLNDTTLRVPGDKHIITSNRGDITAAELTEDDDVVEVPGMWSLNE